MIFQPRMTPVGPVRILVVLIASGLLSACLSDSSFESLDFKQGEKVVFLGNAFFENAFTNSEIETTIALSYPKKKITFRNIGWSGDNVYAHARTRARGGQRFGDPEKGFGMLRDQISALRPDKIFVAYGFNESFDDAGIDDLPIISILKMKRLKNVLG